VAVLGCGIDRDYPAAHAELARRIGERGLVVSEYEQGVEPAPWRFPARNRIIALAWPPRRGAGASRAHWADFAPEDGREVMAVPGDRVGAAGRTPAPSRHARTGLTC
jgi:DNA processing protein